MRRNFLDLVNELRYTLKLKDTHNQSFHLMSEHITEAYQR